MRGTGVAEKKGMATELSTIQCESRVLCNHNASATVRLFDPSGAKDKAGTTVYVYDGGHATSRPTTIMFQPPGSRRFEPISHNESILDCLFRRRLCGLCTS